MGGSGGPVDYTGGGAGPGGGGGDGSDGADECALSFETHLFSPVPGVADRLSTGDLLSIRVVGAAPAQVGVFAPTLGGAQAGSVAGVRQLPQLIECLDSGVSYSGVVLSASGPNIRIRIENA
ncbi:hypothetical protein [uncultured Roseobacter sp.]|uniref:hypothetical protein n=1 Tax=uncultured Roseobacter sp. TaxID=114847 RepID=UPI0026264934|nr:hypothetical protein [uncultured Roseobacter sp.]